MPRKPTKAGPNATVSAEAAKPKRKRAPVGKRRPRAGRPEFEVTQAMRDKVRMLIGSGMDAADVAVVMGCVKQTLYKYFPDEIRHARVVMRAEAIELAWREARDGSSPMIRKVMDMAAVPHTREAFLPDGKVPAPVKAERIGKKQALKDAALNPDTTTTLGALLAERMAAGKVN